MSDSIKQLRNDAMMSELSMSPLLLRNDESTERHIDQAMHRLFRASLRSEDYDGELFATVLHELCQIRVNGPLPPSELTVQLFEKLCGREPLTVNQLTKFFETVAAAVHHTIQSTVQAWKEQPATFRTREKGIATVRTVDVAGNQPGTTELPAGKMSAAGINLLAVEVTPEIVDRKLRILTQLEESDQRGCRWFRLYEFTGATPDEIAKYYSCSEADVSERLKCWCTEIQKIPPTPGSIKASEGEGSGRAVRSSRRWMVASMIAVLVVVVASAIALFPDKDLSTFSSGISLLNEITNVAVKRTTNDVFHDGDVIHYECRVDTPRKYVWLLLINDRDAFLIPQKSDEPLQHKVRLDARDSYEFYVAVAMDEKFLPILNDAESDLEPLGWLSELCDRLQTLANNDDTANSAVRQSLIEAFKNAGAREPIEIDVERFKRVRSRRMETPAGVDVL